METVMVQLKRFLGVSDEYQKPTKYEIKPERVGDSGVRMNMESFKSSPAVKGQLNAARKYATSNTP